MDDADRASDREESQRCEALTRRMPVPQPTGFCLWCGIEVQRNRCFCDPECRDDFELAAAARARNGR
ncbi:MAG: hypothetical protein MUF16_19915 [Burkholderiaceae bacterium]|jgi:hypothetical protein|nr:hypothetical protein [Burkholderiaceae bacterium]